MEYLIEESDGEEEYWGHFVIVRRTNREIIALFWVIDGNWEQAHKWAQQFLKSL